MTSPASSAHADTTKPLAVGQGLLSACDHSVMSAHSPSTSGSASKTCELRHDLIDLGESSYAQGEVTLDDEGQISSYTVAPGDSPIAIGDRFCVDYVTVLQPNNTWPTIDPGEVLVLRPDPAVEWIDETQVIDEAAS